MQIRPAREEDIAAIGRVHVDAWRTAYAGIVADDVLAGLSYTKQADRQRQYLSRLGTMLLVADLPAAGVVGYLTGGPERSGDLQHPAELYAINLLREHRRQGIGTCLVRRWAATVRGRGINSALVWALTAHRPAMDFYQRLGAHHLGEGTITLRGIDYPENALAWEDLGIMTQPA